MTLEEQLSAYLVRIADNVPKVYEAAEQKCAAEHYTTVAYADASGVTVEIPFTPDAVYILCLDPRFVSKNGTFGWVCEGWGFGQYVGLRLRSSGLATISTARINEFLNVNGNRYTFKADTSYPWRTEFAYTVMACRFPDRDDNARIRAFFASIVSETSVTMRKEIVDAAFTEDEWNALLAQYPKITVALV